MAVVKKQRIDEYYRLAKERGYRSRAAFKLLELNKKYNFLKDCRIAIDLCAAPGGWLQILMQEMPPTRKIIGIDLDKIERCGDCHTFQSDITTQECRRELICLLDNNKADIVVHDGAPNFGNDPSKDIFIQNDLVLSALKLATEFLKTNGIFVTKIHRSENFVKILNLLRSLFKHVTITKPLSSRTTSAETYAVCRLYKNPDTIEPSLFDANYLFNNDIIDNDEYKTILLSDFICSSDPINLLKTSGKITIDFECNLLTSEEKEYFKDLKILGYDELRQLIKLRHKIVKEIKNNTILLPNNELKNKFDNHFNLLNNKTTEIIEDNIIEKIETELKKYNRSQKSKNNFYDDKVFHMNQICNNIDSTQINIFANMDQDIIEASKKNDEQILNEHSDCSTDFELNSEELECLAMLKENPEQFIEGTIDKHMIDSDDTLLSGEGRRCKNVSIKKNQKINKKELEVIRRKKRRALRTSNRIIKNIVIEDSDDETNVYNKIYKNQLKKQSNPRKLVFANQKGGPTRLPKGKGKILRLDRRMKHDLYIQKHKKSHKSRKQIKNK